MIFSVPRPKPQNHRKTWATSSPCYWPTSDDGFAGGNSSEVHRNDLMCDGLVPGDKVSSAPRILSLPYSSYSGNVGCGANRPILGGICPTLLNQAWTSSALPALLSLRNCCVEWSIDVIRALEDIRVFRDKSAYNTNF